MPFDGINKLLLQNGWDLLLQNGDSLLIESPAETVVNTDATPYWDNSYTVCQRSGMKYKPGTLVKEWTGAWVHPDFLDIRSEQDYVRVRAEKLRGSIRPEAVDVFLTDGQITADDL